MQQEDFIERRKFPRYELRLPAQGIDTTTRRDMQPVTRDISEQGIGVTLQEPIPLREPVEIELTIPDNNEKIRVRGTAVWVQAIQGNMYRAGICLDSRCLKPVLIVLRMIKVQLKSRYEVVH